MGLLRTAGRAAVASSVHGRVQRRQQNRWAQQDQRAAQQAAPAAATAPSGQSFDAKLAQLEQLGNLRDAGVLTEAEFELKKSKILNS